MAKSLNIKEQIIIGIAAVILITVIFGLFVFKPQLDRYSDARTRQEKEIQAQQDKQAELDSFKAVKSDAAVTEAKSLSLSKRMPEEADLPSILVELDNLGRETDVKVLDITPSEVAAASGYSSLPVRLNVVGTYFNITDYIYGLVKLSREFTVTDVSLDVYDEGYPLLSADISTTAYVYTPNAVSEADAASSKASSSTTSNK